MAEEKREPRNIMVNSDKEIIDVLKEINETLKVKNKIIPQERRKNKKMLEMVKLTGSWKKKNKNGQTFLI